MSGRPPLEGVRVLDFGQVVAVPFAGQVLAWLGAEVILVESERRITTRGLPPFADGERGLNRSGGFNLSNTDKLSCTLNLTTAEARDLAKKLIPLSDVVMENFATGTMERLGLGYEAARMLRPDIIYLSLGAFGRSGPMKGVVGFHSVINAFSGVAAVTGYPGGYPRILGSILPDPFSGSYCILAVLLALRHRRRTGQGQFIDIAMTEAFSTLIPEAVADRTMNGREAARVGNRDPLKAPHDVYPCRGDQRWVAISVAGDGQWGDLCRSMDRPDLEDDPRFSDESVRRLHQNELDPLIASWTRERDAEEVAALLQEGGVPASLVADSADLIRDPHLLDRGFLAWIDHPETGRRAMGTTSWTANGGRPGPTVRAPLMGEQTRYVVEDILGIPEAETRRLSGLGVLQ